VGSGEDILALQDVDPALNAKMHLVNNVRAQKRRTSDPHVLWNSTNATEGD
jgi:hypothetical protein